MSILHYKLHSNIGVSDHILLQLNFKSETCSDNVRYVCHFSCPYTLGWGWTHAHPNLKTYIVIQYWGHMVPGTLNPRSRGLRSLSNRTVVDTVQYTPTPSLSKTRISILQFKNFSNQLTTFHCFSLTLWNSSHRLALELITLNSPLDLNTDYWGFQVEVGVQYWGIEVGIIEVGIPNPLL